MADHARKQIRDALETALTGLATPQAVYVGRTAPIDVDDLPALVINTPAEPVEKAAKGDIQSRALTAEIEGHAQQATGLLNIFDQMAKEIEIALASDAPLAVLVKSADLINTEVEITGEAIQPAGLIRLTYELVYQTQSAAPDVAL